MTETRVTLGTWNERTFWGLIGALVVVGVGLLAVNGPFFPVRNLLLVMFVSQVLPVVIAALVYSYLHSSITVQELLGVAIWGYLAITIAGIFGYFAFAGPPTSYPGPAQEMVNNIIRFLLTTVVISGLYAIAASLRDRPLLTGLVLFSVPFGRFVLYAAV